MFSCASTHAAYDEGLRVNDKARLRTLAIRTDGGFFLLSTACLLCAVAVCTFATSFVVIVWQLWLPQKGWTRRQEWTRIERCAQKAHADDKGNRGSVSSDRDLQHSRWTGAFFFSHDGLVLSSLVGFCAGCCCCFDLCVGRSFGRWWTRHVCARWKKWQGDYDALFRLSDKSGWVTRWANANGFAGSFSFASRFHFISLSFHSLPFSDLSRRLLFSVHRQCTFSSQTAIVWKHQQLPIGLRAAKRCTMQCFLDVFSHDSNNEWLLREKWILSTRLRNLRGVNSFEWTPHFCSFNSISNSILFRWSHLRILRLSKKNLEISRKESHEPFIYHWREQ